MKKTKLTILKIRLILSTLLVLISFTPSYAFNPDFAQLQIWEQQNRIQEQEDRIKKLENREPGNSNSGIYFPYYAPLKSNNSVGLLEAIKQPNLNSDLYNFKENCDSEKE